MVQPRYIPTLFGNHSLATGGFLARCLSFNSRAEPQERTGNEPDISDDLQNAFYNEVGTLFDTFRNSERVSLIPVEAGAEEVMREYGNECIRSGNKELRDIRQFPLRWAENAWKIATCLHAMKYRDKANLGCLETETVERAIKIMRWFAEEFLELMKPGREDQTDLEVEALRDYIARKGVVFGVGQKKSMSIRDIHNNRGWSKQEIKRVVDASANTLAIDTFYPKNGGKGSPRVILN